ncbi:hypothetical protein [Saccharopolyspora phatthalungensis]|uniref:Uncharacterized protein n=1 Tax=Saccharopolyspora phatthalungensis TaxID=664693 RepID=A0A840QHK9_9PSEU|nr:hypothetical protein [Saccharopolyspora phatthalungensis]MBB5159667.1 hypothetical protein [Saccharopolyspora phatthalungensis]
MQRTRFGEFGCPAEPFHFEVVLDASKLVQVIGHIRPGQVRCERRDPADGVVQHVPQVGADAAIEKAAIAKNRAQQRVLLLAVVLGGPRGVRAALGRLAQIFGVAQLHPHPVGAHIGESGHLEHQVGFALFERNRRKVALTKAGRTLLAETRRAIAQPDRVRLTAERIRSGEAGHVRIAFVGSRVVRSATRGSPPVTRTSTAGAAFGPRDGIQ